MARGDGLLMAHLVGALDPGDAALLEEALTVDPRARFRMSGLGFLADAQPRAADPRAVGLAVGASSLLSTTGPPRPGDKVSLRLSPPVPGGEIHPVLWREREGGRDLLHPAPGGRFTSLDRFRRDGDAFVLELVLAPPAGRQVFTLVCLPADLFPEPFPAGDPRWERLWARWRAGSLPGASIPVDVAP